MRREQARGAPRPLRSQEGRHDLRLWDVREEQFVRVLVDDFLPRKAWQLGQGVCPLREDCEHLQRAAGAHIVSGKPRPKR